MGSASSMFLTTSLSTFLESNAHTVADFTENTLDVIFLTALSLFHFSLFVTNSPFSVFIEVQLIIHSIVLMKNKFLQMINLRDYVINLIMNRCKQRNPSKLIKVSVKFLTEVFFLMTIRVSFVLRI